MKAYLFDRDSGAFAGEATPEPGDVPDSWIHPQYSTLIAPPSTPEGMVAKWNGNSWEIAELPPPEELRRNAYFAEADSLRDEALNYQLEAEAWRLDGEEARADAAAAKAAQYLRRYLEVKEDIRSRYPEREGDKLYLTNAGTYHAEGCACTSAAGVWLTREEILSRLPEARACSRCHPGSLS